MKTIDLLNKIANGEEKPYMFKIKGDNWFEASVWQLTERKPSCYYRDFGNDRQYLFEYLTESMLQNEIEIIEEPKMIEKIKWEEKESLAGDLKDYQKQEILARRTEKLKKSLNEIIDIINEMRDK